MSNWNVLETNERRRKTLAKVAAHMDKVTKCYALVEAKFVSGNGVPVERITITRAEYESLEQPQ